MNGRRPDPEDGDGKFCWCCIKCHWHCIQMWTPLSAVFIIYWLSYRPDRFQPAVDSAVLASFDLTNASALRYDLAVDLSFRNSHRHAISYLDVTVSVFYSDTRLGPTDEACRALSRDVLHPAFRGVVPVDSGVAMELQRESAAGALHLRVTVSLTLMYKVFFLRDIFFYKYDCWLLFPQPRNNTPVHFTGDDTDCWRA